MTAPMVLDGAMNADELRAYVDQVLIPTPKPGDIVTMDNLPAHKVAGIKKAIEAAGAHRRYLPPLVPISIQLKWRFKAQSPSASES